jgi:hypothetical protein
LFELIMGIRENILAINHSPLGRKLILFGALPIFGIYELITLVKRYKLAIIALLCYGALKVSVPLGISRKLSGHIEQLKVALATLLAIRCLLSTNHVRRFLGAKPSAPTRHIDANKFPKIDLFNRVLDKMTETGLRSTAGKNHNDFIQWLEDELRLIPGLLLRSDYYDIKSWETTGGQSLKQAGCLSYEGFSLPTIGAVPLSCPGEYTAPVIYIPPTVKLADVQDRIKGRIVLRDLDYAAYPYALLFLMAQSKTTDLYRDCLSFYDRPHSAEHTIHIDLLEASRAGAIGVIHAFDVPGEQVESYFEPHQGVHYKLPAIFVGADEGQLLKELAERDTEVSIQINATVQSAPTRNLFATLPGLTNERVVFASHTDGNTLVQENGVAGMLALAKYMASQPISTRQRTIEFCFGTAHLQVADEGHGRHSLQLKEDIYPSGGGDPVLVIAMEHLGTKEIVPVPRQDGGPGRRLEFSGRNELMLWSVGPSVPILKAVQSAVSRRKLDRVAIMRGTTLPNANQTPAVEHFGGIGTFYHQCLFPTTAIISGPWSLWAPKFGKNAIDVERLRDQTIALGDVCLSLDSLPREEILGGYKQEREKRQKGVRAAKWPIPDTPPLQ